VRHSWGLQLVFTCKQLHSTGKVELKMDMDLVLSVNNDMEMLGEELERFGLSVLFFTIYDSEAETKVTQCYFIQGEVTRQEERDAHQAWCTAIAKGESVEEFRMASLMNRLEGTCVINWEEDNVLFDLSDRVPANVVKIVCNATQAASFEFFEDDVDDDDDDALESIIRDAPSDICEGCEHKDRCRCDSELTEKLN
jgi:hypothetical protein